MPACEKCWGDAYRRELAGGMSQSEEYHKLLEERKNNPCSNAEQALGGLCCLLETENKVEMTRQINEAIDRFVEKERNKYESNN
jgi:hypothetical protein